MILNSIVKLRAPLWVCEIVPLFLQMIEMGIFKDINGFTPIEGMSADDGAGMVPEETQSRSRRWLGKIFRAKRQVRRRWSNVLLGVSGPK